jgi:hypothetical protein
LEGSEPKSARGGRKLYFPTKIHTFTLVRGARLGFMPFKHIAIFHSFSARCEAGSAGGISSVPKFHLQITCGFRLNLVLVVEQTNLKIKVYKTIILPVALYGCETWSLTVREERRLRVFENRVLRRVFGPKRDEVTGEWGKIT